MRKIFIPLLVLTFGSFAAPVHGKAIYEPYRIAAYAGFGGHGSQDGTGSVARFYRPDNVALDAAGNLYVSDGLNETVRKVTPAGVVTTIAGQAGISGSADGQGSAARFNQPEGLAVAADGTIYVADQNNNTIRAISPSGYVSTLAGAPLMSGFVDGTGSAARFYNPFGVIIGAAGEIIISDLENSAIRKVTPQGVVTTFAVGTCDGCGPQLDLIAPQGMALDPQGNLFVADATNNGSLQMVAPDGTVSTVVKSLNLPAGLVRDAQGNFYFTRPNESTIFQISPARVVTRFAGQKFGYGDGLGKAASFAYPVGLAIDPSGNMFVADQNNDEIRKVTPQGLVTTVAGLSDMGGLDGTGTAARFFLPVGIGSDAVGTLYVADSSNQTLRKITPQGVVTTLAGKALAAGTADGLGDAARFNFPAAVALDPSGNIFVADTNNQTLRKITPGGNVTTFAGSPGQLGQSDGTGSAARFNYPRGIAVDSAGNVYVGDAGNDTIRKVTPAAEVTTLAGSPLASGFVDGTGANARFHSPCGVAVDGAGNIFVADNANNSIREVTPAGVVTTLAGSRQSGAGDGMGAAARFYMPFGVAVDSSGNVFVADEFNCTLRKITPAGSTTTLVGYKEYAAAIDGRGRAGRLQYPTGVAVDGSGNLYEVEQSSAVRKAKPTQ